MKDVIEKNGVRDAALLESILKFIAANIGCIVSTKIQLQSWMRKRESESDSPLPSDLITLIV
jgi:hypothetical protein